MSRVDEAFRSISRLRAPDLWSDIERRTPRPLPPGASPARRVGVGLVAFALVGAGVALAVRAFRPATLQKPLGPSGIPGKIAFIRAGVDWVFLPGEVLLPAHPDVYVLDGSRRDPVPLISTPALEATPAWDPTGSRLAFASTKVYGQRLSRSEIVIATADGVIVKELTRCTGECTDDSGPSWSPDGQSIAFWRSGSIYVIDVRSANLREVVPASVVNAFSSPVWSPDGRTLAFAGATRDRPPIETYVVHADGSDLHQLTTCAPPDCEGGYSEPAWSPDGSTLAVVKGFAGRGEIYLVEADGGDPVPLTRCTLPRCPYDDADPAWSPDGREIVFARGSQGEGESQHLFTIRIDGTGLRRLTSGQVVDCCPSWAPD